MEAQLNRVHPMNYSLRHVQSHEIEWLYDLNKASFHESVVLQFGKWDDDFQRGMFFSKWEQPRPAFIIEVGVERVGVVIIEQRQDCDWLHEIQLCPSSQGRGLGTILLRKLMAEARSRNVPLRLQVLHANQDAKRLYDRLGFLKIQTLENHHVMEVY